MKLGIPVRGFETDTECPECGDEVKRRGQRVIEDTGRVVEERYECTNFDCLHSWWEDAPTGVYIDG